MELASRYQATLTARAIPIRVPWFGRVALALLTVVALLVLFAIMATRQFAHDPFAEHQDLFTREAEAAALARGFTCQDTFVKERPRSILSFCHLEADDATFSTIKLWIADGITQEIRFSVRESTLRLGDFILLWGRSTSVLRCEMVVMIWPEHYLMSGAPPGGRIDVLLPVRSVTFTPGAIHRTGGAMMNEGGHNCRNF